MKKIKRGDFWMLDADQMWEVVNSLQSELEALEGRKGQGGMTVEDIFDWIWGKDDYPSFIGELTRDDVLELAKFIQPLTVPQGFVVDWSKAPDEAQSFRWGFSESNGLMHTYQDGFWTVNYIPRPLPPKVTRERTDLELVNLCFDLFGSWETVVKAIVKEGSLKNLCTAAGISTTTEEV